MIRGSEVPGREPGVRSDEFEIEEVGWFDLRDERDWGEAVVSDSITYPQVIRVAKLLGYRAD